MKRLLPAMLAAGLAVATGLGPAGAQPLSTPVTTQENVRHLTTVPGNTGGHVVVEGDRLYMGNYGTGLSAYDISDPRSPEKIGQYLPGPSASGDPGLRADAPPDAAIWDGRHIVSLGGTGRVANQIQTEFLDFTDPADPQLLWRFTGSADRESHNGDIADGEKLWIPSGGGAGLGLRIYDMSPLLEDPPQAPVSLFQGNPHTLWTESRYREATGAAPGSPFNHTHDVEIYEDMEILLPEWEWQTDETGTPVPTYGTKDILLLAGATGYAVGGAGANDGAVYIIDITDPQNPEVINKWQNPPANSDMIRYLHEVQFLHGDPSTMVVTDEDLHSGCEGGRLYTVRVSEDLMQAEKAAEWAIGEGIHDTPTCAGSHVLSSHDRHVFMGAYTAGLQVIDLRNPAEPVRAGRYIAEGMNSWGALYHDGVVYVGDFGGRGLDVFEFIQDPVAKAFVKAPNPGTRTTGGIAETGCRQGDPYGPTNGTDGLIVPIPEEARDGTHVLRALGSSGAPYDLDIWFHFENCESMGSAGGTDGTDAVETIPAGAVMASVDLYTGSAQWVYGQVTTADGDVVAGS